MFGNKKLKQENKQLQETINALNDTIKQLDSDSLRNTIFRLNDDISNLNKNIDYLSLAISHKESELNDLNKNKNILEGILFDLNFTIPNLKEQKESLEKDILKLESNLNEYKTILDEYTIELNQYEEKLDFNLYSDLGFYDNNIISNSLSLVQDQLKQCIKNNNAVKCSTTWTINNSAKQGEIVVKNISKLILRSFNNESNLLISKVKIDKLSDYKNKIIKSYSDINKFAVYFNLFITDEYLKLKLKELEIEYFLREQKIEEKEELKRIQLELKEQKKVEDEYAKELLKIEKEENLKNETLLKTKIEYDNILQELTSTHDKETVKLQNSINKLSLELELIKTNKERVKSLAEQTKCGFVYIISNEDSFGKNIFKIGLTRRLNPLERINELSNASVPFKFNIHGIIYSDDAPNLEKLLHVELDLHRVNKFNKRKEFFNTTLQDIKNILSINNIDYKIFESAIDISDFNIADSIILNNKN